MPAIRIPMRAWQNRSSGIMGTLGNMNQRLWNYRETHALCQYTRAQNLANLKGVLRTQLQPLPKAGLYNLIHCLDLLKSKIVY